MHTLDSSVLSDAINKLLSRNEQLIQENQDLQKKYRVSVGEYRALMKKNAQVQAKIKEMLVRLKHLEHNL